MISWNLLGILLWVIVILYLVFIIQNIRRRRIEMIIKKHQRFNWPNFILDVVEIVIFIVAALWMFNQTALDNPNLDDTSRITSSVKYEPLIMNTGSGNSSYVTINSSKKKNGSQTYTYYRAGSKITVTSDYATVSYGNNPMSVNAEKIPYELKKLKQMDEKYQRAYVAIYTARYKKNWQNGIGMHAGRIATQYYLIRIPDSTFVKQKRS
ncbi:LVIS_2131 family protein [Lactobacillus intestinalis]|uniref:LVIS_2131 family protein n=1 Tax=Lactobacillus intestinalis TaxID=151781 RepID=UPI001F5A89C1|nr:LVIS_2131 family protein [Lactobacillus intestinalis]